MEEKFIKNEGASDAKKIDLEGKLNLPKVTIKVFILVHKTTHKPTQPIHKRCSSMKISPQLAIPK